MSGRRVTLSIARVPGRSKDRSGNPTPPALNKKLGRCLSDQGISSEFSRISHASQRFQRSVQVSYSVPGVWGAWLAQRWCGDSGCQEEQLPQHVDDPDPATACERSSVCERERESVHVRAYFAAMLLALAQPRLAGAIARSAAQPRQLARNSAAPDAK